MRVVFRADATPTEGTGHIMRCWALAETLVERGIEVVWLGQVEVQWLRRQLLRMEWVLADLDASVNQVRQTLDLFPDIVVVDSYLLEQSYREDLIDRGVSVVAIVDDSHPEVGPGSLFVNPGVASRRLAKPGVPMLEGPEYVLIRREIRRLKTLRYRAQKEGRESRDLIFLLGGADSGGLGTLLDKTRFSPPLNMRCFAGPRRRGSGTSGAVTWLEAGTLLLEQAALSALVVTPAGVASWEMLHIGVPVALINAFDNQAGNYAWMTHAGLAWPLGTFDELGDPVRLTSAVGEAWAALTSGKFVGADGVIDGRGAARVADAIYQL